jgi:cytochrome c oxidase subunit 2
VTAQVDQVTNQGDTFNDLWPVFLTGAVLIVLLIWGLTVWSVVKYRRRRDATENPDQTQYHVPLEVTYTAIPLLIVAVLFVLSVRGERDVTRLSSNPDVVVEVLGFQWQWQFDYEGEDVLVSGIPDRPPTMVVPVGATVRLQLVADDVIHSFWVPEFLEKRDLIPGRVNEVDVRVTEPGRWVGRCAEFCGLDHAAMRFAVEAVSEDEYEQWLDDARATDPTEVRAPSEDEG